MIKPLLSHCVCHLPRRWRLSSIRIQAPSLRVAKRHFGSEWQSGGLSEPKCDRAAARVAAKLTEGVLLSKKGVVAKCTDHAKHKKAQYNHFLVLKMAKIRKNQCRNTLKTNFKIKMLCVLNKPRHSTYLCTPSGCPNLAVWLSLSNLHYFPPTPKELSHFATAPFSL